MVKIEVLKSINGLLGACLVDYTSGMVMAKLEQDKSVDIDLAAAGNTEVVAAKQRTMASLKLGDEIEDILISLTTQYHIIRPLSSNSKLFLYAALDRDVANLAMARYQMAEFDKSLDFGKKMENVAPLKQAK